MAGDERPEFRATIDAIYDSIGNGGANALPAILASAVDARSCTFQVVDRNLRPSLVTSSYFGAEMTAQYVREGIYEHDIWGTLLTDRSCWGRAILLSAHISEERYRSSHFFTDFIRANGDDTGQCLGIADKTRDGSSFVIGIQRPFAATAFGADEAAVLDRLRPHIQRLVELEARLGKLTSRLDLYEQSLAAFPQPCILVKPDATIAFANAMAEDIFTRADGLMCRGERLFSRGSAHARLELAIDQVLKRNCDLGGAVLLPRAASDEPYRLVIHPFYVDQTTYALILIDDPARLSRSKASYLINLYGLTPAERDIALLAAEGLSVKAIGEQRRVSEATVKTLLQRTFRKTQTSRLSELARLVNTLPG